ncbi:hypothetical protein [Caldisphaera lagunensis]|nr:hypothetical protein [Caldisphaera lagunensis]
MYFIKIDYNSSISDGLRVVVNYFVNKYNPELLLFLDKAIIP